MNRITKYIAVLAITGTMFAQTKPTTNTSETYEQINQQYQLAATKAELNYNKLRDIQAFQEYLQALKTLDDLSKKAQALQQPAPQKTEAKPTK